MKCSNCGEKEAIRICNIDGSPMCRVCCDKIKNSEARFITDFFTCYCCLNPEMCGAG